MGIIYENGIVNGLINILLNEIENLENSCIYCFEQKSYTLYVKEEKGWEELSNTKFRNKIFYLQRNILKIFRSNNNIDELETDREYNIYNKRLKKICVEDFGIKIKTIRNELYRNTKINIQKLVMYDFTF